MCIRKLINIVFCIVLLSLVSCATTKKEGVGAIKINDIRGNQDSGMVTVKMAIDRMRYRQSLINTEVNSVRIVEIFQRLAKIESRNYPMYRIFDVKPGATYDLLGLKNGDVIVAASGYVIQDSRQFKHYVNVLEKVYDVSSKEKPCVEIVREGIPYKFIYYFSPKPEEEK